MNVITRIHRAIRIRQAKRYRRWLYDNRVILPAPKIDERSSIEAFGRIMNRPQ